MEYNEKLFWKFYRNNYLRNMMFYQLKYMDIHFEKVEHLYIGNRIGFKLIKSLTWITKNETWELLQDKLKSDQYISIKEKGIVALLKKLNVDNQLTRDIYKLFCEKMVLSSSPSPSMKNIDLIYLAIENGNLLALKCFTELKVPSLKQPLHSIQLAFKLKNLEILDYCSKYRLGDWDGVNVVDLIAKDVKITSWALDNYNRLKENEKINLNFGIPILEIESFSIDIQFKFLENNFIQQTELESIQKYLKKKKTVAQIKSKLYTPSPVILHYIKSKFTSDQLRKVLITSNEIQNNNDSTISFLIDLNLSIILSDYSRSISNIENLTYFLQHYQIKSDVEYKDVFVLDDQEKLKFIENSKLFGNGELVGKLVHLLYPFKGIESVSRVKELFKSLHKSVFNRGLVISSFFNEKILKYANSELLIELLETFNDDIKDSCSGSGGDIIKNLHFELSESNLPFSLIFENNQPIDFIGKLLEFISILESNIGCKYNYSAFRLESLVKFSIPIIINQFNNNQLFLDSLLYSAAKQDNNNDNNSEYNKLLLLVTTQIIYSKSSTKPTICFILDNFGSILYSGNQSASGTIISKLIHSNFEAIEYILDYYNENGAGNRDGIYRNLFPVEFETNEFTTLKQLISVFPKTSTTLIKKVIDIYKSNQLIEIIKQPTLESESISISPFSNSAAYSRLSKIINKKSCAGGRSTQNGQVYCALNAAINSKSIPILEILNENKSILVWDDQLYQVGRYVQKTTMDYGYWYKGQEGNNYISNKSTSESTSMPNNTRIVLRTTHEYKSFQYGYVRYDLISQEQNIQSKKKDIKIQPNTIYNKPVLKFIKYYELELVILFYQNNQNPQLTIEDIIYNAIKFSRMDIFLYFSNMDTSNSKNWYLLQSEGTPRILYLLDQIIDSIHLIGEDKIKFIFNNIIEKYNSGTKVLFSYQLLNILENNDKYNQFIDTNKLLF